ncbi:hypothetical protein HNQ56_002011 [Anaerotaenia torta]|uniref:RsiV family protein n=1 Tax=Anaerotaenia torta TaxID=433293 RepID=UPI003D1BC32C
MEHKHLQHLKKEYMETPIPEELEFLVQKSLRERSIRRTSKMNKKNLFRKISTAAAVTAASVVAFTISLNTIPSFAMTLSQVPVLGSVVRVLTIKEYRVEEDGYNADIKVPSIQGLENQALENSLNEKYLAENKDLYDEFMAEIDDMKESGIDGHLGVESGYIVKTDTDQLLSVARYVVNTVASSSTVMKYDTIDKANEILITLPSLFKDSSYIDVISENIKEQMLEQYKADENKIYWIEGIEPAGNMEHFDKISENQSFYITSEGKLVIAFDKYEAAPGYMGVLEFEIPTDILSGLLVGNEYIK